jgi:hypothetical protein
MCVRTPVVVGRERDDVGDSRLLKGGRRTAQRLLLVAHFAHTAHRTLMWYHTRRCEAGQFCARSTVCELACTC